MQIENVEALAELDPIVQTPGLDSVALGPFDLAASMGYFASGAAGGRGGH